MPSFGGRITNIAFYRCPFQCMRLLPENQLDHLQSLLTVWQGPRLLNSLPHGFQFPSVDLRQLPQGGVGYRITGLAVGPRHPGQVWGHLCAAQFFLPGTQFRVAANHAFYIRPPVVSWATQSSSPPRLYSMSMPTTASTRSAIVRTSDGRPRLLWLYMHFTSSRSS